VSPFAGIYDRGPVAAQLTDAAWLQAMLDVEAALARAGAALGEIPAAAADQIAEACAGERFDAMALEVVSAQHATPVVGLVAALREAVGPGLADHVHAGATSQDIVDTALMLLARRALAPLLDQARDAADAAARLAAAHRDTPMIGRTLLQQALPITFGLRAAGWLSGLDAGRARLTAIRAHGLPVQMGGPVGARAPELGAAVAAELGLADPGLPWGAIRVPVAELAGALGVLGGVAGKIARDVTLLAASEVGEVAEVTSGASSAMAHKRNPVAAVSALACARRTPAPVATLLAAMESEHERAAGAWQAEWGTLVELIGLCGSAVAWTGQLLEGLQVDVVRMAANLAAAPTGDRPVPIAAGALVDGALARHGALGHPGGPARPGAVARDGAAACDGAAAAGRGRG
jgi:3-carboxy-cis,cis-muconate cycloisomerase